MAAGRRSRAGTSAVMRNSHGALVIAFSVLLAACATDGAGPDSAEADTGFLGSAGASLTAGRPASRGASAALGGHGDRRRGYTDLATASLSRAAEAGPRASLGDDGRTVSLNFVDADVQEFVRIVFDEVLKESAIVDPGVSGKITVRTVQPVSKASAVELVRNVLQMNGASLTRSNGVYRIEKAAEGRRGKLGDAMRVFPLQHIDADQARSAIQSVAGQGAEIFSNKGGRFLVVSGAPADLNAVEQVLASLDVDQMAGMSFALVPLQDGGAQAVAGELTQMFGQSGALKAVPIQRMNALLLIGRTPAAVERAKAWIRRLDQAGQDERKVFVYAVQNRRAQEIAKVLNGMLGASSARSGGSQEPASRTAVAPTVKTTSASTDGGFVNPRVDQVFADVSEGDAEGSSAAAAGAASGGRSPLSRGEVAVSADLSTNSLVVIARPDDYRLVEAAIRRLDVQPAQVIIEATIFEVQLNDTLRHGVRWFFEQGNHGAILTDANNGSLGPTYPGFNYIFQVPKARIVLNALESMTRLEVISSPALTVLDNQTATLKVGDQVPIATRSAQSTTNPDAPIVNDIELKDTGVILSVTPRVNAGGLVQLDISQEVSDVVETTTSSINSPTIRQRSVNSSVAVQSGTEIILGGLISRRSETGRSGLPLLKDIPVLGEAFTSNATRGQARNELLIIIRPVVMSNQTDVLAVTQEIKARMQGLPAPARGNVVKAKY
ncbi:MAG: type II secretion system protein GspD [Ancylobacter novellus]|uniref:Type II secretion system protein GspD n=1 Tax=Ancylobacter novellus TaxID=921 RepID=A0A2W5K471_ANCNO|nr:MAG: type II secretion system protein GspD [Ancylobacter novellus]